jgi:tRNA threonylcarbamoyladenosine biosynthesis protein TsaB
MNLLSFDTSTSRLAVALLAHGKRFMLDEEVGNTHSQSLLPTVQRLMADANITFATLDAVAFGVGPGSFTGVRIACACAQGIGFAHAIPLVPIGTLEALAYTLSDDLGANTKVWCVNDARMNEVYCAGYQRAEGAWNELVSPRVCRPEDAMPPDASFALAGDAFSVYQPLSALAKNVKVKHLLAGGVLEAATHALNHKRLIDPANAEPIYVRDKVALTEKERAAR